MLLSQAIDILSKFNQNEEINVINHNPENEYKSILYTVGSFIADLSLVMDYCGDIQHTELAHISASKYLDLLAINNNL